MVTRRRGRLRQLWGVVNAWDLWWALAVAIVSLTAMVLSTQDLEPTGKHSTAAWTGGIALAGVSALALRWISDRMRDSAYGELVRAADPSEADVALPFWVAISAGVTVGALGLIGALVDGELVRPLLVLYWTSLIFTSTYALLATTSILRLAIWHQRQHARLQSQREAMNRVKRRSGNGGRP